MAHNGNSNWRTLGRRYEKTKSVQVKCCWDLAFGTKCSSWAVTFCLPVILVSPQWCTQGMATCCCCCYSSFLISSVVQFWLSICFRYMLFCPGKLHQLWMVIQPITVHAQWTFSLPVCFLLLTTKGQCSSLNHAGCCRVVGVKSALILCGAWLSKWALPITLH